LPTLYRTEIEEGLKQGKTPYSIGKELSAWVEKLFEAKISPRTIEQKARRTQNATNVANSPSPEEQHANPQKTEISNR